MVVLSKEILKQVGRTNGNFNLITQGDKVAIGLSGGKDSLALIHAIKEMKRRTPFEFEYKAITVDYGMGENFDTLLAHTKEYNIPHDIIKTNIYNTAKEKIRPNSSSCSFFSRMRRGALYSKTLELGFNKLALGHHFDDTIESYFMNMFYNGQLRALSPKYTAGNGLVIIRPLIQIREKQLIAAALDNNMPTIGDETCPSAYFDDKKPYARANMKRYIAKLEGDFPNMFVSMNAAFKNISDDTFFDITRFK